MAEKQKDSLLKKIFQLSMKASGKDKSIYGVTQSGDRICHSLVNSNIVNFYNKNNEKDEYQIQLPQTSLIQNFEFDNEGVNLAIQLKDKVVIYNVEKKKQEPIILESEIGAPSCMAWSVRSTMIAFGTVQGGLVLYSLKASKKTNIAGKHSKRVTNLAWNGNDVIVSRAEDDSVQVTKDNGENHEEYNELVKVQTSEVEKLIWIESTNLVDKMHTFKQQGQVPSKTSKYQQNLDKLKGGKPTNENKSDNTVEQGKKIGPQSGSNTQLILALITKSGKEAWLIQSSESLSVYKIPLPSNVGRILDIGCSQLGELIISSSRGVISKFTFNNGAFSETANERFFQNSLELCYFNSQKNKAFICGDNCMKVVDVKSMKEEKEYRVNFDKSVGTLVSLMLNKNGSLIFVATSSGVLLGYMVQSEQKAKLFTRYYSVKTSLTEILLKPINRKLDNQCIEEFDSIASKTLKFQGAEIVDYVIINDNIVVIQDKHIICYSVDQNTPVEKWRQLVDKQITELHTDHKSKIMIVSSAEAIIVDIKKQNASTLKLNLSTYPNFKIKFFDLFTVVLSRNQLTIFENTTLNTVSTAQLRNGITDFFVCEHSMEFYLYDSQKNSLLILKNKLDVSKVEFELPEKGVLSNVLFDMVDSNVFCIVYDSGRVFTVCKKSTHYKNPSSLKVVREILQPSDLEDTHSNDVDYAVTLVDSDIHPLQLTDGYLFCLEKGVTPIGCYLSSHSFKIGTLYQLNDEVNQKVHLLLNEQNTFEKTVYKNKDVTSEITLEGKTGAEQTNGKESNDLTDGQKEYFLKSFFQTTELSLFALALKTIEILNIPTLWNILAANALKNMNLDIAKVCYQKLGNWSMSYYIQNLLSKSKTMLEMKCEIAVILCDYDFAKNCYLQIGKQELAVELLINLHEYQAALDLAKAHNLQEHEIMINFEIAELDLKNEEYIKAENGYEVILKRLSTQYGIDLASESKTIHRSVSKTSSINVLKDTEKFTNSHKKDSQVNEQSSHKIHFKKFNPITLCKATMFGITSLFIKQGSLIKASELIGRLSSDSHEELEELAQIAKESEHYLLSSDIYSKIGCVKNELEVKLLAITKANHSNQQQIDEFGKIVSLKINDVTDSEVLLKLAFFFQDKDLALAERLFQKSENVVEYIKFTLFLMSDITKAERIYAEHKESAQQAAFFIAEFFIQNLATIQSGRQRAIKYFLYSGRKLEALKISFETDSVEHYCDLVQHFDEKEANTLAKFFISKNKYDQAGKFFLIANQYEKALLSFVKAKDFDSAIDLVFKLNDEELFELMVQVFAGETLITANDRINDNLLDGENDDRPRSSQFFELINKNVHQLDYSMKDRLADVPEPVDPIYLFKLYLRFGKVEQANTIALAIIDRELIDGSYKSAYQHACTIYTFLMQSSSKFNIELRNKIIVLHSYGLVKKALKNDNHILAALLLNRVCSFLHYLPKSDTDILTSAVIEATKSGFKSIAYNWALTLCKPQYRSQINPKFKDKIEKIALKPVNSSDNQSQSYSEVGWMMTDMKNLSGTAQCPSCNLNVNDVFSLNCSSCFNNFGVCIATGKALLHCTRKTFVKCLTCYGIGYEDEVKAIYMKEGGCPMCNDNKVDLFVSIDIRQIVKLIND